MNEELSYLQLLLRNLRIIRERVGISASQLEERLILGPGWVTRFESGETTPSVDMILAILHQLGANLSDLLEGLPGHPAAAEVERFIFAEEIEDNLVVNFRYARHDASYKLLGATLGEFEQVIKTLRDGLSRLGRAHHEEIGAAQSEAIKTDAVKRAFQKAIALWPDANPSDLWWFIIQRAYLDPYNHPAKFARLSFEQSWKRTGGWALEQVLVEHYAPFLLTHGINLFIADVATKQQIVRRLEVGDRLEADKMDVILTAEPHQDFLGVVHVKASFAERRTDDQPMSTILARAGYLSPFLTMDCKSTPSSRPVNKGELGGVGGKLSAKRKDIEKEGYFTGCFSYNRNTVPSSVDLPPERRVYVCDFSNPDDSFSQFIIQKWQERQRAR
ncbi:MAG TPA: helix-turn-helix domain-containing protein [Chloroflexia bacterium]|jgi:transcriptional regulator with XRE-family HTH domain